MILKLWICVQISEFAFGVKIVCYYKEPSAKCDIETGLRHVSTQICHLQGVSVPSLKPSAVYEIML